MIVRVVFEIPDSDDDTMSIDELAKGSYTVTNGDGNVETKEVQGCIEVHNPQLKDYIDLDTRSISNDDVIIFRYDENQVLPEDAVMIRDMLKLEFPDNKILGITSNVEFLINNADEAVAMLNKMITHINLRSSGKSKIVLT